MTLCTSVKASAPNSIGASLAGLTYGNGLFVAVGAIPPSGGSLTGAIFTSPDGVTWTQQSAPLSSGGLGPIVFGGGTFVALDVQGQAVVTSTNGIAWTRTVPGVYLSSSLVYGDGKFLLSSLGTSTDGITWSAGEKLPDFPNYNGGIFLDAIHRSSGWLAVGAYEAILTRP